MKNLFIKTITKQFWKISTGHRRKAFAKFSHIEKNSGAQLLCFLPNLEAAEDLGAVFNHAIEELGHAQLFAKLAGVEAINATGSAFVSEISDVEKSQEITLKKLAFISVNEGAVNHNFGSYLSALNDKVEKNIFLRAQNDEEGHAVYTRKLLLKLCHSDKKKYSKLMLIAQLQKIYKNYIYYSSKIGGVSLYLVLTFAYYTLGLLCFKESKKRLRLSSEECSSIMIEEFNTQISKIKI